MRAFANPQERDYALGGQTAAHFSSRWKTQIRKKNRRDVSRAGPF
jgi:hypothetical protein